MNNDRRSCSILLGVWLAILFLFGTAVSPVPSMADPRGEIRVVENWRPDINVLGHNVLQYLFDYALDRNELASSLGISKKWINDTTLEIKLRQGVRFHNGEIFDAEAVKFNFDFQRIHNPSRGVQVYLKNLKEILVIDPHTVHFALSQPDALILNRIAGGPYSGWVIGAPRYMERVGWQEFLRRPIGTGPYMIKGEIKDYRKGADGDTYATLTANPDYWDPGYPKIKKIDFVHYAPEKALSALIDSRVDLVTSLIPKDTTKVAENPNSMVVKGRQDVVFTVGALNLMSTQSLPLRDMRVRKALNYAVNKEELIRYAFKGNASELKGVMMDRSGVDLSGTESYDWNIPKARELMKEAGYEDGFSMKLCYLERDSLIARFLQRFFRLINVDLRITPVPYEWLVEHMVYPNTRDDHSWEDEDWWMTLSTNPSYVPEAMAGLLEWFFHFDAAWKHFPDWLIVPLDRMYCELLRTTDRAKRFQIYKKANEYIADQALWVFTVAPLSLYGVNKEVNFVPQVSQYLYLDYSYVSENHCSLRGKNN